MYTKQALRDIGIHDQLNPEQLDALESVGYFIVENVLTDKQCDQRRQNLFDWQSRSTLR